MTQKTRRQPTGTVTFMFTDIVGSTDMWETHGDAFLPVLQTHNAILSEAIERNGGYVMKTEGDSFKVAFQDAASAVRCAMVAQAALQRYPWPPDVGPVRVRMGVHTGKPFVQSGDYFGPPVNRAARIMDAANGGQVLISQDTLDLVESRLAPDMGLADLGFHQLRDLDEPLRLFEVSHGALGPRHTMPPRSLNAHAHNLPMQRTSFIGRQEHIEQVATLLAHGETHCLQVTGPQGIGKTRLSLQVAAEKVDWFPDGVWYIRLTDCSDSEEAAHIVAQTLNIPGRPGATVTELLREWMTERRCLLILDDCGQIPEVGRLIHDVLSGSANLRCLTTASEALQIGDAPVVELPEMSLPADGATAGEVMQTDAGRLFVERTQEARADFGLTEGRAKTVSKLLRHLGGFPAAIERAAEMMRGGQATPAGILTALGQEVAHGAEDVATVAAEQGRALLGKLAESPGMAALLSSIGATLQDQRRLDEADRASRDALRIYDRTGDANGVASSLRRLGLVAAAKQNHERAAGLLQAARDAYRELDVKMADRVEAELAIVRRAMGSGARMPQLSVSQAVAMATAKES